MTVFSLVQSALMRIDPEDAHKLTMRMLKRVSRSRLLTALEIILADRVPALPVKQLGLDFKVPIGLAAGFDKDGLAFPALGGIGFGFIEVGTVTPRPQKGNPRPRIFRVEKDQAIINRMGFNSCGVDQFIVNLQHYTRFGPPAVLGINIGKNSDTPNKEAINDYQRCYKAVYPYADYIAMNVSSPNSPGLRELQKTGHLTELLDEISQLRGELGGKHNGKNVPLALKISPDMESRQIEQLVTVAAERGVDAIIATNTTTDRSEFQTHPNYRQNGGLSGRPLCDQSTQVIREVANIADGSMTIIGCGGITSAQDAWDKLLAGADLVQVYSSMIYRGTGIVKELVAGLTELAKSYGEDDFAAVVTAARQRS